jgi:hypothetical protein
LRKPILQEEDMLYTVAAAEAGLIYTDEVRATDVAFYVGAASVQMSGSREEFLSLRNPSAVTVTLFLRSRCCV